MIKKLQGLVRSLPFRLTFWMTLVFSISMTAVLCATFMSFSKSITRLERDELRGELEEYSQAYTTGGLAAVKQLDLHEVAEGDLFIVDVTDAQGRILYARPEGWKQTHPFFEPAPSTNPPTISWMIWKDPFHKCRVESVSLKQPDGVEITLALHTTHRKAFLRHLVSVITAASLLSIATAFLISLLVTRVILRPLRHLIVAIEGALANKETSKPLRFSRRSRDELDTLARLFNDLLDRLTRRP